MASILLIFPASTCANHCECCSSVALAGGLSGAGPANALPQPWPARAPGEIVADYTMTAAAMRRLEQGEGRGRRDDHIQ